MADAYDRYQPGLTSPAVGGFAVVPHNTNELPQIPRALRIGSSAGTLSIVFVDGSEITIPVQAYEELAYRAKIVKAATTVDVWGLV